MEPESVIDRFIATTRERLHARDPWTRGHYAEALVAEHLPGSRIATHSASPHDIEWDHDERTITIAVRTTGSFSMDHQPGDDKPAFPGRWTFKTKVQGWNAATGDWHTNPDGTPTLRRLWADIAVLCHHSSHDITTGWNFYVLDNTTITNWPTETISPTALRNADHTPHTTTTLRHAIEHTATTS